MNATWTIIFTFSGVVAIFSFGYFIGFRNGLGAITQEQRGT